METIGALAAVVGIFIALDAIAWRWGIDSRDPVSDDRANRPDTRSQILIRRSSP